MDITAPRARLPGFAALVWMTSLLVWPGVQAQAEETMRQYQLQKSDAGYRLELREVPKPSPAAGEVLVRVRAVSLNRRDIYVLHGQYPGADPDGLVPLSDGAGEVIAVGNGVTRFRIGDRVAGTFFQNWVDGRPEPAMLGAARGGGVSGMLSEMIVSHEDGLVSIPAHLSFEEAATLPCAGVTAWNALFRHARLKAGEFVLLEGTGGVSIFGLQFAAAAGAKPIITSSSDAKLERARALGAIGTVNYRSTPKWAAAVRELTGGAGVDHVLEVGGVDTLPQALEALAFGGHIAMIGGLSGFVSDIPLGPLMMRSGKVSGIYVGSRADFEAMNEFIGRHGLRPVVDRVFAFEDAPAAFELMERGGPFGKIVITL
jgi:NADPH:quinone reductase-like Zn-dependent oxidoreductase